MNKILLLGFSVLLFYAAAQGLICKVCKFKVGQLCFLTESTCIGKDAHFCERTEAYLGGLTLYISYGCNELPELCNKTEQRDNVFDISYNRTCCNYDLCNGGIINTFSHPFISGLSLALGLWLSH